MSNRPDHFNPWRGWGLFSGQRGAALKKREARARAAQGAGRVRARFLRMETLESRELLAAIARFDFDSGNPDAGPNGWTHLTAANAITGTLDTVGGSGIGVKFADTVTGNGTTYTSSTVPSDLSLGSAIRNGFKKSGTAAVEVGMNLTLFNLDSTKSYEVWVIGGNNSANQTQKVTVEGSQIAATFDQSITTANSLWVNGSVGSSSSALTDFSPVFVASPLHDDLDNDGNLDNYVVRVAITKPLTFTSAQIAGVVIREFVLPSTATLPASGGPFTLSMSNGSRVLKNNSGTVVTTLASTGPITINGSNAANDRLNVDFTAGNPLAGGVTFNGGEQAGDDDRLSLSGYSLTTADGVADVTVTHTGAEAGSVTLAGLGTVSFAQIEPLALAGTAADLVITLPAGPNTNATLGDDGVAPFDGTNDANTSAIYDMLVPGTFEYTEFTNPTNTLKINRGSDSNTLTVQSLVASGFDAALTIGAAGSELTNVIFNGPITLTGSKGLSATASKAIQLNPSATITTTSGNISLSANQQATPGVASFFGIDVFGAVLKSTSGNITLAGRGGTNGSGQVGVLLEGSAVVGGVTPASATTGTITITGTGGSTSGNGGNSGVRVDSSSTINSNGGDIQITGTGGTSATVALGANHGVSIDGLINTVGSGKLTITGSGATAPAAAGHLGVSLTGSVQTAGGKLTLAGTGDLGVQIDGLVSAGADIEVSGTPAASGGVGIKVTGNVNTFSAGNIKFTADGMNLGGTISPESRSVTLLPKTVNRAINLGGADSGTQLGLSDLELDAVTAGTLNIGDANSGAITFSTDITRPAATVVNLTSGGAISFSSGLLDTAGGSATFAPGSSAQATFGKSGTDVSMLVAASLPGTLNFAGGADPAFAINGTTADSQYEGLNVAGNVNLTGTDLVVSGGYTPTAGDTFAIVKYSGTRTGTFSNSTVVLNGKTLNVVYDDANKQVLLLVPPPGSLGATLDTAGNLTVLDTDATGKNNNLTVKASSGNLIITDAVERFGTIPAGGTLSNGDTTLTIPLASVLGSLTINGAGGNDSLTLDLATGNPFPTGGISYSGGNPTTGPGDKFTISGGSQGVVTYNYTNAHDGNIVMGNFGTVNYTGLEPITNSGTASDVVFNLPVGPNTVTLGDDGTVGNSLSRLSGATFETTSFANPTGTLTIKRGNAADTLTVNALPDFTAGLTVGSTASEFSTVTFSGAVTLATGKPLSVLAGAITANAAITTASGSIALNALTDITLNATLASGGGDILISADSDGNGSGTVTISEAVFASYVQQSQLTADDGAAFDQIGRFMALSSDGNTAIVGANNDGVGANAAQGSVYVFTRTGAVWSQQQHLTAADGATGDGFGASVALSSDGNTAIIGAFQDDNGATANQGSAYVFTRTGGIWTQQQKLTAADGEDGDAFGISATLSGDGTTAIVGAFLDDIGANVRQGSAYVFALSGGVWTQQQQLTAADGASNDFFGVPISLSGDGNTAIFGASSNNIGANAGQGSAYVFTRTGGIWTQQQQLTVADGAFEDFFGSAVAISSDGNLAIVGASGDDVGANANQGSAYVFTRIGGVWTQQQQLAAGGGLVNDQFGSSAALSSDGSTAIVGAFRDDSGANVDQGSAFLFTRTGGIWSQQQQLTATGGAAGDFFGIGAVLSSDGSTAIVGADRKAIGGNANQGAAFVFVPPGTSPRSAIAAGGGNIVIKAAGVAIEGAITSTSTVSIMPSKAGQPIDIGTNTAGSLGLTDSELDKITAATINIGNANSGTITVSAAIDRAAGSTTAIKLTTGGNNSIVFSGSGSLDVKNGDVTLLTNSSGSGSITSGSAAVDVSGANVSLTAGSGGIGRVFLGASFVIAATNFNAATSGNADQSLSVNGSTTIDSVGLSAGTGTISFVGGTFNLGASNRIDVNSSIFVNGGTLALGTNDQSVAGVTLSGGSITGPGTLTSSSTFQTRSGTIGAVLAGANNSVGLIQSTPGTTTLSGANTYSGDTVITSSGLLALGNNDVIPDGPGKGNVVFNNASNSAGLSMRGFSDTINGLSDTGAVDSTISSSASEPTSTLTIGNNNQTTTFNGVIRGGFGTLSVRKIGTGTLTLGGANTYDGDTTISAGTLKTGGSGVLPSGRNVSIQSGATLNLGGSQTIGSLSSLDSLGGDTITNSAAATLTLTGSGTFYGTIANGSGGTLTSLTVDAAGKTVDLFGNNTYTGATTVSAGTLLVDGFGGTNLTSSVTVASGATLGGSGKIGSANGITVNSGGHLAPTVLSSGSVSLSSGANYDVRVNGTTLGSGYNQENVTGAVNLGGATLNVTLGFTPAVGNTFPIILNDGAADAVNGTFNGLPEGTVMNVTTGSFSAALQISYVGGDGNDVLLKALSTSPVLDGTAGNDTWLVKKNATSGNTDISLNGTVVLSAMGLINITINGQNGNDSLTVDLSEGNAIPSSGITFNGGENTGDDDRLKITGYNLPTADGVADVTVAHTSPEAGSVVLAGLGTVFFTQIEPLALAGTAADLVITLPAGPNPDATLGDDGVATLGDATNDANTSAIYDSTTPGATFEYTEFTNPTNTLTINRGSATDNLTVLDLVASGMNAGLTIGAAGAEFGKVSFAGPITLAADKSLSTNVSTTTNSGSITLTPAAKLAVSGTGGINFTTTRDIAQAAGSTITAVDGSINFSANRQATPTAGGFVGITVQGSILTSGTGSISLSGRGGNAANVNFLYGIMISDGQVRSTGTGASAGTITINGTGGTGTGTSQRNVGVEMDNATTVVSSVDGNVTITGNATTTVNTAQDGIRQTGTPRIDITGIGTLTLTGTPGVSTGGNNGVGLRLAGPIDVTGSQTTLISNRMAFSTADFSLNTHGNTALLRPLTNGTPIDLGSTAETNATVTLELSDAELDKITTGTLQIGNANSGTISITNVIGRPALTNVSLISGGSINFITAASSGSINTTNGNLLLTPAATGSVGVASTIAEVNLGTSGTAGTLSFADGTDLAIAINGQIQGSDYHQLTLSGNVNLTNANLTNVDLKLTGTYKPVIGDKFTIVNNTLAAGLTSGIFNGLTEGMIFNPAAGNLNADLHITYKGAGGVGNDVILTAINVAPTLNAISDPITILEGAGLQTIDLSGITAGGTQAQTLTVTATSSNPTLIASPISVNYTSSGSTGSLSYTPEPGQFGTAVITVTVKDNGGVFGSLDQDTVVRTFVVRVGEVNDAPTGGDDTLADIAEDSGIRAVPFDDLLANDLKGSDSESSQTLTITAVNNVVGGTAEIQGTNVLFTPTANYHGQASFVYTLRDNGTTNGVNDFKTSTATVTFNITEVNDLPTGGNDFLAPSAEDAVRTIAIADLLLNDTPGPSDESGQNLSITAVGNSIFGVVAIQGTNIVFTPQADYNGPVSFIYTLRDDGTTGNMANPQSATATVTFTVNSVNDPPISLPNNSIQLLEDSAYTFRSSDFLFSDLFHDFPQNGFTGVFLDSLPVPGKGILFNNGVPVAVPSFVSIADITQGLLRYVPNADGNGIAYSSFTFRVKDDGGTANGGIDTALVASTFGFDVVAVNDPPTGINDSLSAVAEESGDRIIPVVHLLANDRTGPADEAGQILTMSSVSGAIGGTVQMSGTNVIFTPSVDYNGPVSFVYTLRDDGSTANGGIDTALVASTVTFNIFEVNDAPTGVNDSLLAIAEDSGDRTISMASLVANDSKGPANESGQTLTITGVGNVVGGTVQINGTNVIFSPAADYNGPASFVYTLSDDGTTNGAPDFLTSTATVSFTITEKNDAPTGIDKFPLDVAEDAGPQSFSIDELLGNDFTGPSDESGQTLTLDTVGAAVGGTVQIVGQNVVFTPLADYNGPASFQYTFHDDGTTNGAADPQTGSATVSFTIFEVNDTPTAGNDSLPAITEDSGPFPIFLADLLANDLRGPVNESSQVLTFLAPTGVVGGTAQLSGSQITFRPADDFSGTASFVYSLRDNGTTNGVLDAQTGTAVVSFRVTEINDAPIGHDDSLTGISGNSGPRIIPFAALLGNDETGPASESNQSLTISDANSAVGGTVEINALNQTIIFTPAANFQGPASFVYTLQDDGTTNGVLEVKSGTATATFNITSVNAAPTLTVNLPPLTAGAVIPQLVADLNPGSASSNVGPIEVVNGIAYFSVESPSTGIELWRSDGTAAGTKLVKDIFAGTGSSQPAELTNIGGVLYFRADDGIHGFELWKSDGTENGTVLVKDLVTEVNLGSYPGNFTEVNGKLFFTAADQPSGSTTLFGPSPYLSSADSPFDLSGVGSDFRLENFEDGLLNTLGVTAIGGGVRAPSSSTDSVDGDDGTIDGSGNLGYDYLVRPGSSGITFVFDANALGGLPSNVGIVITNGFGGSPSASVEYFDASGLLITRQTNAIENLNTTPADDRFLGAFHAGGIRMIRVSSVGTGISGLEVDHLQYGNIVQPTGSAGLWTSDGTSDGTTLLKNFSFTPDFDAVSLDGKLIFTADDGTSGTELWTSDGTSVGTIPLLDIQAGAASSNPKSLVKFGSTVFFQADDGIAGAELWQTDGSPGGTALFKDINAGALGSNPSELTDVNGTLFFSAGTAQSGVELWKSDGTESGTVLVKDIRPGVNSSEASGFTAVGNTVYFVANDTTHLFELWKSDGTAAGTVLVKDIFTGANSSSPMSLSNISGRLLFSALAFTTGHELWFSAGTEAGTTLIKDIRPGAAFSAPLDIVALPQWVVFSANNGTNGRELWAASLDVMAINEDADTQTIDLSGISAGESELQSLTITVTSDNPGLIPDPTIDYTSPDAAGTLSFKPVADQFGTAVITVTIKDDGGTANGGVDTLVRTFTIVVSPVNDSPTFQIAGNQTAADENPATKGPALPMVVTGWASNINLGPANETSQTASFVVENSNPSLFAEQPRVDPDGTLHYTPKPNAHGIANLTVQLVDGGDGTNSSAKIPFTIEITKTHKLHNAAEAGIRNGRDVTGATSAVPDGFIVAGDVLAVINYINAKGSGQVPADSPFGPSYPDVNGDDQVVAGDALSIINYINAGNPSEGEATSSLAESYFADLVVEDQAAATSSTTGTSDGMGDLIALLASDAAAAQSKRRRMSS